MEIIVEVLGGIVVDVYAETDADVTVDIFDHDALEGPGAEEDYHQEVLDFEAKIEKMKSVL